jgi:hypothetical protein
MILEKVVKRILPPHLIQAVYYVWYGGRLIGMTSLAEQKFYTECAAMLSGAKGAIVDLGCWMCSTAISLAKGLRPHGEAGRCTPSRVYAFDRFVWEAWMDRYLPIVSRNYLPGDSFLPEAQRRIKPYSDLIELVEGDLTTYVWQGGPIKLLLVDAMKSWQLAQAITSSFYPSLREGSVLIHQDFKHYWTQWIHIVLYRLRYYFRLMREVTKGVTV